MKRIGLLSCLLAAIAVAGEPPPSPYAGFESREVGHHDFLSTQAKDAFALHPVERARDLLAHRSQPRGNSVHVQGSWNHALFAGLGTVA